MKRKLKTTEQNLPPISLVGTSDGNMLKVSGAKEQKPSRKTDSILARMPKVKSTSAVSGRSGFGGLGGLIGRVQKFTSKEMALAAGAIGSLMLLPVGLHYMSAPPQEGSGSAKPGFYANKTGSSGELFEPGLNGFAPGGTGAEGDMVTPLSVRDPLSLIIGAGDKDPEVEAASASVAPAPKNDFRDAVASAAPMAARAVGEAMTPAIVPRMMGSIRGLDSVSGGGSGISGQAKGQILSSAQKGPGQGVSSDMVNPIAMKGYKGVSTRGDKVSSNGAYEALKAKAGSIGDNMNLGSAVRSLDKAAKDSDFGVPTNSLAFGGLGSNAGQAVKGGAGNSMQGKSNINRKNSLEEELRIARAKAEQENELAWKKFWKVELPMGLVKTGVEAVTKPVGSAISASVGNMFGGGGASDMAYCVKDGVFCPIDLDKTGHGISRADNGYWKYVEQCKDKGGTISEDKDPGSSSGPKPDAPSQSPAGGNVDAVLSGASTDRNLLTGSISKCRDAISAMTGAGKVPESCTELVTYAKKVNTKYSELFSGQQNLPRNISMIEEMKNSFDKDLTNLQADFDSINVAAPKDEAASMNAKVAELNRQCAASKTNCSFESLDTEKVSEAELLQKAIRETLKQEKENLSGMVVANGISYTKKYNNDGKKMSTDAAGKITEIASAFQSGNPGTMSAGVNAFETDLLGVLAPADTKTKNDTTLSGLVNKTNGLEADKKRVDDLTATDYPSNMCRTGELQAFSSKFADPNKENTSTYLQTLFRMTGQEKSQIKSATNDLRNKVADQAALNAEFKRTMDSKITMLSKGANTDDVGVGKTPDTKAKVAGK